MALAPISPISHQDSRLRGSCREQGTADHRNSGQELTHRSLLPTPINPRRNYLTELRTAIGQKPLVSIQLMRYAQASRTAISYQPKPWP
ncbi:hypothetical protein BJP36_43060 [Moorena producens JHB]|uniref:Uncharacterized protein n=1 Tax=Moorena producens (strain JHB) TaxID=1454205 RepID=A0A9Q9UVS7_MOOP1|nr:hypothetical protein [Moorena producens]WAN69139.1 hypothetical protein BJP36_43060 [Moorena producens JHB]